MFNFRKSLGALGLAASIALSFGLSACTKKESTPGTAKESPNSPAPTGEILIGEVGSMSGSEATFGESTHEGLLLAIEEGNAAGGVKGLKMRLISLDNQGKPEEAAMATTKLINQERVTAIIGEVASSRSLAMAPIAQANKVPMISPSSTNPKVTEMGDYIFRVCFIDPFQGTVMAKFARENLKVKKVAILRDIKNDYSVGLSDYFTETFKKMGGEIVADQSYSSGDVDFKSQLTSIKAKGPEAVYIPGYYTEVGLIARQARQIGLSVPLMGGDGWDSEKLWEIGGKAMNNAYFSNHYSPDDTSAPHQKAFLDAYKARWNKMPNGLGAMGYDAGKV
jgi:branched-chain amino acid transport system substrate-binding protein